MARYSPAFVSVNKMSIKAEIPVGEFLDKLIILRIKLRRVRDEAKLKNIGKEHTALSAVWKDSAYSDMNLHDEIAELEKVNEALWQIEDDIRAKEAKKEFDETFIRLARSVYLINDKRAAIKKRINEKTGSELVEEKSYADCS